MAENRRSLWEKPYQAFSLDGWSKKTDLKEISQWNGSQNCSAAGYVPLACLTRYISYKENYSWWKFNLYDMFKLLLIAANYPLRTSLFKIWSYNHKDIRRDNLRWKVRLIKPYLEQKVAYMMKRMYYFP